MNIIRLSFQKLLSAIARPLGFNHLLSQFCDRCGHTNYLSFWADIDTWEAVAGNVNGCHHGAYCAGCFTEIARRKGIFLNWQPFIVRGEG